MEVRRLNKEDMRDFYRLSSIAFTYSREPEAEEPKIPDGETGYGAFDGDKLMSGLFANDLPCYFHGREVKHFGVGSVATFPEYRGRGAVKAIFAKMLREYRDAGYLFSSLMPFSHAFYRKFGYEVCYFTHFYEIPLTQFASFPKPFSVRPVYDPEDTADFLKVYKEFACRYNFAIARSEKCRGTEQVWSGHFTKDKAYRYVLYNELQEPEAYASFTKGNNSLMEIGELAFISPDAMRRLFGFLSGFYPNYKKLYGRFPTDLRFEAFLPDSYDIVKSRSYPFMHRVLDVIKATELLPCPETEGSFTLKISDRYLEENDGVFLFTYGGGKVKCEKVNREPDGEMDISSFTQLISGGTTVDELLMRSDVKVNSGLDGMRRLFKPCPIYSYETF